jgi:hypothetical protein
MLDDVGLPEPRRARAQAAVGVHQRGDHIFPGRLLVDAPGAAAHRGVKVGPDKEAELGGLVVPPGGHVGGGERSVFVHPGRERRGLIGAHP